MTPTLLSSISRNNTRKKQASDEDEDDETDTKTTHGDVILTSLNGEKYIVIPGGKFEVLGLFPVSVHFTGKPHIVVAEK